MKKIVGIDIAKLSFDVCYLGQSGQLHHIQFSNDEKGFRSLKDQIDSSYHLVLEATGPYYYGLACYFVEQGYPVSVINPLVAKRFCQMRFQRNKTDKADANSLREYGQMQDLQIWQPISINDMQIKQLYGNLKRLIGNRTSLNNQLKAYQATGYLTDKVAHMMQDEYEQVEGRIQVLEQELQLLIEQSYPDLYANICTIPGIGPKSALLLLMACRGFQDFVNAKQVIAYLGTSPRTYQSGTSVKGRAKICKLGMAKVRAVLYMAARSAKRYNNTCKQLYERLISKGKPHRVAMIAVVNKLIKQVFAIAKNGTEYNPEYSWKANLS